MPGTCPPGSTSPSNDKLAFLKNLTRHMIGMNSPAADTAILDNLLTDAIVATYQRCRTERTGPSRPSTIYGRSWRRGGTSRKSSEFGMKRSSPP